MNAITRAVLLVCLLSASCWDGKRSQPETSGNTNWLKLCASDSSCGADASCVCGICTRPCGEDSQCSAPGSGAQCVAVEDACATAARRGNAGICLRGCTADAECGAGERCEAGGCVRAVSSAVPSAAPDVGAVSSTLSEVVEQSRRPTRPAGPNTRVWSCEAGALRVDPSGYDEAFSIALTQDSWLVAGVATDQSDGVWRVERRGLADLVPAPEFGSNGAIASGKAEGWDSAAAVAADATFLYVAGVDDYTMHMGSRLRLEKRLLATGALVRDFGSGGSITPRFDGVVDHVTRHPMGHGLAIDVTDLYWVGTSFGVEKRRLSDGAPREGFGEGGLVRSADAQGALASAIALADGVIYVAGAEGTRDFRLEARDAVSGRLLYSATDTFSDASCNTDSLALAAGAEDGLYVASGAGGRWRVERRTRSTGELVYAKEVEASGSCDAASAIAVDERAVYVAGELGERWRVEKRSLGDGELVRDFGEEGAIDLGLRGAANAIALRDGVLYVAGIEGARAGTQNSLWRIERRSAEDGTLLECPAGTPDVPRAPECSATPQLAAAGQRSDCALRIATSSACAAASVRASATGASGDWTFPEGAVLADGQFASTTATSAGSSALLLRGFGFAVPSSARVRGITVTVARQSMRVGAVVDHAVRLVRGARTLEADRASPAAWSERLSEAKYGGATDLWSTTWSAADLNDPSFGVALQVRSAEASERAEAKLDSVRVAIEYCE